MYTLIDKQGMGAKSDDRFLTLKELHEALKSFHSLDNDTEKWTLMDCLEIGDWEILEDGEDIDLNDVIKYDLN